MVNIGVRADSGSWNTMAIRSPRISLISSSVLPMSSSPFMMMEPVTLALSSSRPIRLNAVTDLPEPDSPTMPSVRPRHRSKLTPRTARHTPASVAKDTCRSRTCMIGSPFGAPLGPLPSSSSYWRMSSRTISLCSLETLPFDLLFFIIVFLNIRHPPFRSHVNWDQAHRADRHRSAAC